METWGRFFLVKVHRYEGESRNLSQINLCKLQEEKVKKPSAVFY